MAAISTSSKHFWAYSVPKIFEGIAYRYPIPIPMVEAQGLKNKGHLMHLRRICLCEIIFAHRHICINAYLCFLKRFFVLWMIYMEKIVEKLGNFLDVTIPFKQNQYTFRNITGNPYPKDSQTITEEWEGVHFTVTLFKNISSNKKAK